MKSKRCTSLDEISFSVPEGIFRTLKPNPLPVPQSGANIVMQKGNGYRMPSELIYSLYWQRTTPDSTSGFRQAYDAARGRVVPGHNVVKSSLRRLLLVLFCVTL